MRNATILVVRLQGVATEAIKNIVLAGIGKLVVADPGDVVEQDLGAGFFYRDDDVGKKVRVRVRRGGQLAVGAGPRGEDVARTHGPRVLSDPAGPSAYGVRAGRSRPRALSDVNSSGVEAGRFGAAVLGFPFAAGPFPGCIVKGLPQTESTDSKLVREGTFLARPGALGSHVRTLCSLETAERGHARAPVLQSFSLPWASIGIGAPP